MVLLKIIRQGFLYLKTHFHLCIYVRKNMLSAMHVDWDPPHSSLVVCYILYQLVLLPCRNTIKQGMEQKWEKCCFRCKKNAWHVESNYILQPPEYFIIVVNRFRYINNSFTKDRSSIAMDMIVVLSLHNFSLQATIDHHGPSMHSGHYTASNQLLQKNILLQRHQNYGVWSDWHHKHLCCLCGNV